MSTQTLDQEKPRVVLAGRAYEVTRNWAAPPSQVEPGRISTLAVDSDGQLYVLRRNAEPPVLVYSPHGEYVRSLGHGLVFDAHGIAIDRRNRVLVVDRDAHQVICFSREGEVLFRLGERHRPRWAEPFNHPTDVAVAPDGEVYVSDGYGNGRVHCFSPQGELRVSFGALGRARAEFMTPHALIIDRNNHVLVVDRENNRVQQFDRDGGWLSEWTGLCRPMDLFERDDGVVLVSDQVPSVCGFSPDGVLVGRGRPSFNGAHGLTGDGAGVLYLTEMEPNSITRLTPV